MASHMRSASTVYHGTHEYSTFSSSTIGKNLYDDENLNTFQKYFCILCRLSKNLILHPVGPFRCIWDMFVMILLIYTSIEIPFTMSFGQSNTTLYISVCVDLLLFIDIFLNFHTAYFDKYDSLRLVTNKKYICKKYFRTWFLIDFITCIPFELFIRGNNVDEYDSTEGPEASRAFTYIKILRVFRLLRIIKILRFLKMLRIFDAFMKQFVLREVIVFMKLFKIICGMLMFAHFAACLWWFVGSKTSPSWIDKKSIDDNINLRTHAITLTKYSYAWYWAVVTLFTTGYGDVVATNTLEQWVCSISILIGTCFFAYFVGTLTVLITEGDKIKSFESDKLEEAQSFCEKKKLPKELTRAILTHVRYHCQYNYVFNSNDLIKSLPPYLQTDIHKYLSRVILSQIDIFKNLNKSILGQIALKMRSISCNEDYELFKLGDKAQGIYIQRTGVATMRFYGENNNKKIIKLKRGHVFGEYAFISPKRKISVECNTWSEFYILQINDILNILKHEYPSTWINKWKIMRKIVIKNNYITNKKYKIRKIKYKNHQKLFSDHNLHHQTMLSIPDINEVETDNNNVNKKNNDNENILNLNNKLSTFLHGASTVKTARFHGRKSIQTEWDGSIPSNINTINVSKNKLITNSKETEIKCDEIIISQIKTPMTVINEHGTFHDDVRLKDNNDINIQSTDLIELQMSQSEPYSSVGIFEKTFLFKQNSSIRHRTMSSAHKKKMSSLVMSDMKDNKNNEYHNYNNYMGSSTVIIDSEDDEGDIGPGLQNIAIEFKEQNIMTTPSYFSNVIDNLDLAYPKYIKSKKQKENNKIFGSKSGYINNSNNKIVSKLENQIQLNEPNKMENENDNNYEETVSLSKLDVINKSTSTLNNGFITIHYRE
eukprot:429532_1